MALTPTLRTAGLTVSAAASSAIAVIMWTADHKIDLYAILDQASAVAVSAGKLLASIMAVVTVIAQVWKSSDKNLAIDLKERAKDPESPLKGVITKDTPEGHEMARTIPGPVVAAGTRQAAEVAAAS